MKKDKAALFVLFSILTYVSLAEAASAEEAESCYRVTTSAVAGQGRYEVYCGEEQVKNNIGDTSFKDEESRALIESKNREKWLEQEISAGRIDPKAQQDED